MNKTNKMAEKCTECGEGFFYEDLFQAGDGMFCDCCFKDISVQNLRTYDRLNYEREMNIERGE